MVDIEINGETFQMDDEEVARLLQMDTLPERTNSLENEVINLRQKVQDLQAGFDKVVTLLFQMSKNNG